MIFKPSTDSTAKRAPIPRHPLAGRCQVTKPFRGSHERAGLSIPCPAAVAERTRFFNFWLRRESRQTPVRIKRAAMQAKPFALVAFATPEELWCRNVSMGLHKSRGLPIIRRQSVAGSHCRRSALTAKTGDGGSGIPFKAVAVAPPSVERGLPVAVVTFMRSSVSYQMVCAP